MSYKAQPIRAASHSGEFPYMEYAVQEVAKSWLIRHSLDYQLLVYHYTNGNGLKGIVENRSIWCTYINVLNDPEEYQYGQNLIEKRIDNFIENEINDNVIYALEKIKEFPSFFENTHKIFIASFCENKNLLSQWRGYSKSGVGYNLGFNFDTGTKYWYSKKTEEDIVKPINLRKVIYKETEQIEIIDTYIIELVKGLKKTFGEKNPNKIEQPKFIYGPISVLTSNLLLDMTTSMKNSKFQEESEWRLLRVIRNDEVSRICKYRIINDEYIPYLDTNIFNLGSDGNTIFPLESIKIGPMLEYEKNKTALNMFINTETNSDHKIHLKNISVDHADYYLRRG